MEGDVIWSLKWTSNFPLHNMVYIKPIITMQGNHSHVTKVIPTNFVVGKFVVAKFYVDVDVHLTTKHSYYQTSTTKSKKRPFRTPKRCCSSICATCDVLPNPLLDPSWVQINQTTEMFGTWGTLLALNTKRGRGACWSSGMGLGRGTSFT
jgi:hypothetical protein